MKKNTFIPIAIVGVGALFAKANNAREYWKNIIEQRNLITEVPESHWLIDDYFEPDIITANQQDKIYNKWGSFLDNVSFDPLEYGTPPATVPAIDTSQLLALIVAKQVLNDVSQNDIASLNLNKTSVILGTSVLEAIQYLSARIQRPIWAKALQESGLPEALITKVCDKIANAYPKWQEDSFPGLLSNVVAGRIANRFNCGGTNCTTDAACASSLSAVSMAVNELQLGLADMVITGGVDTLNDLIMYKCFSVVTALSPSGYCRPFSAKADGTLLGEGIGLFAFKRLEDAEQSGNYIYGVIRGVGTSSDGRSKSIYAPNAQAQSRAVLKAYQQASYDINTVELIEAHGTGTIAGDLAEYNGLVTAFRSSKDSVPQSCALGSVKSQIGHTKSAAGAAGLLKVLFALRHKVIPATINVEEINPKYQVKDSPLYINTKTRPWISRLKQPRRAGVSCFGFGGSNFHLTVEEYANKPLAAKRLRTFSTELIIITAKNHQDLLNQIMAMSKPDYLARGLLCIAYETQKNLIAENSYRLTIIAHDINDLAKKMQQALIALSKQSDLKQFLLIDQDICYGHKTAVPQLAFCFPDQDSIYPYMADEILMGFEPAIAIWEQLAEYGLADGLTLAEVVYPPYCFKDKERNVLEERLKQPHLAKPALVAASLSWLALLKTLQLKPNCTMGKGFGEMLALYAAGTWDLATLFLMAQSKDQKTLTTLTKNIKIKQPEIPVYTNSKNHLYESKLLALHTVNALKFSQSIRNMYQQGVRVFIETGPARTLKPLIEEALTHFNDYCIIGVDEALTTDPTPPYKTQGVINFWRALGQIVCCGLNPQFSALWEAYTVPQSEQTTKKLSHTLSINGTNYQKPYPSENTAYFVKPDTIALSTDCTIYHEKGSYPMHDESKANPQQTLQQQLIEAQTHYQRVMTESHIAFLDTIAKLAGQGNALSNTQSIDTQVSVAIADKQRSTIESMLSSTFAPTPTSPVTIAPIASAPLPVAAELHQHKIATNIESEPGTSFVTGEMTARTEELDTKTIMLKVIVEKTGYPADMLQEDMDIEADLGIDSIKRVEILSALREQLPALPEMDPAELANLRKLSDIRTYLEKHLSNHHSESLHGKATQPTISAAASKEIIFNSCHESSLKQLVLNSVVEKTGYPLEMLTEDMDIEADLGIDSIKRVEILSSLRETMPNLPEMDAGELAALKTLSDITGYLEKHSATAQQSIAAEKKN